MRSWRTTNNIQGGEPEVDNAWKSSQSWKLVRLAEKEMFKKMHADTTKESQQDMKYFSADLTKGKNGQELPRAPGVIKETKLSKSKVLKESRWPNL